MKAIFHVTDYSIGIFANTGQWQVPLVGIYDRVTCKWSDRHRSEFENYPIFKAVVLWCNNSLNMNLSSYLEAMNVPLDLPREIVQAIDKYTQTTDVLNTYSLQNCSS